MSNKTVYDVRRNIVYLTERLQKKKWSDGMSDYLLFQASNISFSASHFQKKHIILKIVHWPAEGDRSWLDDEWYFTKLLPVWGFCVSGVGRYSTSFYFLFLKKDVKYLSYLIVSIQFKWAEKLRADVRRVSGVFTTLIFWHTDLLCLTTWWAD